MTAFDIAFWTCVGAIVVAVAFGLVGVWWDEFWKGDIGWRLMLTDAVIFISALAVALIFWIMGKT